MNQQVHTAGAQDAARAAFQSGNAALARSLSQEAVTWYRRALDDAPHVVAIYNNMATALLQLGDAEAAIQQAETGLQVDADFAPLHNTLGNALVRVGRLTRAAKHYRQAMLLAPEMRLARINLANVLRDLGEDRFASAMYGEALKAEPEDADALGGLALLHMRGDRHDEAIPLLKRALTQRPGDLVALNNLAICLLRYGRRHEALALYRDLVTMQPENAEARGNLGQLLQGLGRHDEAVGELREALSLAPERSELKPAYMQSLRQICAWQELDRLEPEVLASAESEAGDGPVPSPFVLAGTAASPALRLSVARRYAQACVREAATAAAAEPFSTRVATGGKLRVGYVSPDFRRHSVATSFLPLLKAHGRRDFEWHGFLIGREEPDEVTEEFEAAFDSFQDLRSLGPHAAAQRINEAGLDLLIDLAGHTRDSALEIFAWRPAPVQAHYLGYGSTLGADCIDYLITDAVHTPAALEAHCHEACVFLPATFMAAGPYAVSVHEVTRKDCGLPERGAVLACFNAHYKLDRETFAVWMELLQAVPDSVLWLKDGASAAMTNLDNAAAAHGVDPARLVWAGRMPHGEHLARHRLADLALDTRRHTGGVTTLDALWAGVPVLTVAGESHAARTGASILSALGMAELIAKDLDDYRDRALALLRAPDRLAALTHDVERAKSASPLFRPGRLSQDLEAAYAEMVRRHRAGEPPSRLAVADLPQ